MVDIPCLPNQTFFCAGFPKGLSEFAAFQEKTQIILAEKWQDAREYFEEVGAVDCVLIVSQKDVKCVPKIFLT